MPKKDEFRDFQDRIFDALRDMEDADLNQERKNRRWAISIGSLYGLSEDEILDLRKPGMKYVEWLRTITEAGKKRRNQEPHRSR